MGGVEAAREQLTTLIELSERPNITIRVIPFSSQGFSGMSSTMLYLSGPVHQLDTVQVETPLDCVFLDTEAQLRRYRSLFAKVKKASLDPADSRDLIHRTAKYL